MASTVQVLLESFRTLREKPVIFLPKLFSTFLSSLTMVWLLEYFPTSSNASASTAALPFVFLILLGFVGVAASMMVASMVKYSGETDILKKSAEDVFRRSKTVLSTTLAVVLLSFLISFPAVIGLVMYQFSGGIIAAIAGITLSFLLAVFFSFASYFLPITLLEKDSLKKGFSASMAESRNNSREVTVLLLFSIALLGVAFASTGTLEKLGYAGFLAGRMVSAVINTYFFVVSPTYYLEDKN